MKDNRFKLTAIAAIALLAVGVGLGAASQRFRGEANPTSRAGGGSESQNPLHLNIPQLLANVIQRWQQQDGLTADVVWQVDLFGQTIHGTGEYTQTGRGRSQRHGLSLRGADSASSIQLQQAVLSTAPVLWTQWKTNIEESASMIRLNEITSVDPNMPRAGIAHLIWRLQNTYDFNTVQHIRQGEKLFLLLQGIKKAGKEQEMNLLPFLKSEADGISILLDASTGFPHRLQWETLHDSRRVPIVKVDLIHIRGQVSANTELLQPKTIVPDAKDQTETYRLAVSSGAGGRY
ncbi:hypothetical protein DTL42_22175 [Bremerella cremea]|uniref:Uncharacterized protein n=1 Tax=Bremerella cremea TaxID=1031537 RepID=A0A368KKH6_9BACT|nr:hypothetical protein [Bremerella cremea]RCS41276.1 hypothetical protein DTL42_22175 [Bremerella cremea]